VVKKIGTVFILYQDSKISIIRHMSVVTFINHTSVTRITRVHKRTLLMSMVRSTMEASQLCADFRNFDGCGLYASALDPSSLILRV
jgi:hypothetical protein